MAILYKGQPISEYSESREKYEDFISRLQSIPFIRIAIFAAVLGAACMLIPFAGKVTSTAIFAVIPIAIGIRIYSYVFSAVSHRVSIFCSKCFFIS